MLSKLSVSDPSELSLAAGRSPATRLGMCEARLLCGARRGSKGQLLRAVQAT